MNYYNENDPNAAQWLRNLIAAELIPAGTVDDRSIADVRATDLVGFTQCHFFAGIGGWSLALDVAGWPRDRPVWTASCPCQPFSGAGKRAGVDDHRHLWPEFERLVAECNPPNLFGEQVASPDGRQWLARVRLDLETLGYAVGAADLCAAGVEAPHMRQRLYWLADALRAGRPERRPESGHRQIAGSGRGSLGVADSDSGRRSARDWDGAAARQGPPVTAGGSDRAGLGDTDGESAGRDAGAIPREESEARRPLRCLADGFTNASSNGGGGLGVAEFSRLERLAGHGDDGNEPRRLDEEPRRSAPASGRELWRTAEWLVDAQGKARRVKPGLLLLAHGIPGRVGRLRAYGNAIVPELAAEFIRAALDVQ